MKTVILPKTASFSLWREKARACLAAHLAPHEVLWQVLDPSTPSSADLFATENIDPAPEQAPSPSVPLAFLDLAEVACSHADPARFALLYKVLWRVCFENRQLLSRKTDDDVLKLNKLVKAVRHDAYKITAFLRFRECVVEGTQRFIAWYEPEHYTLPRVLPFFQTRFKNMHWAILTPYLGASWDQEKLHFFETPDPNLYPKADKIEDQWLVYYASIFNPARVKEQAMLSQMPKKYWKNMPETALVADLLHTADKRARQMLAHSASLKAAEK